MNIVGRVLTLNPDVAAGTVECIAGCRVELNAFELAGMAIAGNPGFTLRCVLEADDRGTTSDEVLFTFPISRRFTNPLVILDADQVFRATVSADLLNEDVNGADEIRARFTLVNNANGQRIVRRSAQVQLVL